MFPASVECILSQMMIIMLISVISSWKMIYAVGCTTTLVIAISILSCKGYFLPCIFVSIEFVGLDVDVFCAAAAVGGFCLRL